MGEPHRERAATLQGRGWGGSAGGGVPVDGLWAAWSDLDLQEGDSTRGGPGQVQATSRPLPVSVSPGNAPASSWKAQLKPHLPQEACPSLSQRLTCSVPALCRAPCGASECRELRQTGQTVLQPVSPRAHTCRRPPPPPPQPRSAGCRPGQVHRDDGPSLNQINNAGSHHPGHESPFPTKTPFSLWKE